MAFDAVIDPPVVGSIAEHGRDPLVDVEDAGFVEEHLPAIGDDSLDHLVDGVVQGCRRATAIGEQPIALGGEVRGMFEAGFDQQNLTALLEGGAPHLIDPRRVPVDLHRLVQARSARVRFRVAPALKMGQTSLPRAVGLGSSWLPAMTPIIASGSLVTS